jgi:hypothetical protein
MFPEQDNYDLGGREYISIKIKFISFAAFQQQLTPKKIKAKLSL